MNLKRPTAILINLTLVLSFIFCNSCSPTSVKTKKKSNSQIKIGFSMDTLKEERWYKDQQSFEEEIKKKNANVITKISFDSSSDQLKNVKELVSYGIDVLVIIPHDAVSAAEAVNYAKKRGIRVISYDRLTLNTNIDLYISFDNEQVGVLQADAMVKAVPEGNYVIIKGPSYDYNTTLIYKGIMKVLTPYVKSGKIKVVKVAEATDWLADEAQSCISMLLQDGVRINGVIAENDGLAGGAISALAERQLVPEVAVTGMDADLSACQRIVEGQQLMTVYKPIDKLAHTAADIAIDMAKGETPKANSKISNGKYTIPYYKINPIAVYKNNMNDTVIKDKFHSSEDIYMNIAKSED